MAQSLTLPTDLSSGLLPDDPALERYRVRPAGVTALPVEPGDIVTVIDRDGGQRGELTVLAPDGKEDFAAFDTHSDAHATVLAGLLDGTNAAGQAALADLCARGLNPREARAVQLFGEESPPRGTVEFHASRAAVAVIAAPSRYTTVHDLNPPSDLTVEVRRSSPTVARLATVPPPLAEPVVDMRVDAATARAYEVKAGQFIQIIDVQGRQCSDFLAFDRERLDHGQERGLDSTATRYFMGQAYPQPGLHGKFFDQDMRPLVEVVQDTVGRHDTFGLACNSKFYEDFGYFGHVNCTDNFNRQLAPYTIASRKSWPALNLFYNTFFDQNYLLMFDEPWSRPGDHVLLRAATDLVCASSACPDDIDQANAWVPTDIHVRVYSSEKPFQVAIARRTTPEAEPTMTKQTGFHPRTERLTRQFTEYRGYWVPDTYDNFGAIAEYWACRQRVAMMDLSPLRKFEVLGPDAEALLQASVTRNVRKISVGQVAYTAVCNTTGCMVDDATIFRLGDNQFRFVGGDEYGGTWLREKATELGLGRVQIKHSTDHLHNVAVQGPHSRELLAQLIWTPETQPRFGELANFRFAIGRLHGFDGLPIIVSRTGYTGELGYELWCHPDDGPALWDAVWDCGQQYDIAPLGMSALDMLRIESALAFAGHEFGDTVDPFEAGIGFTVPLKTKEDDFAGREALLRRKAKPQHELVGLELDGNEPAAHGDDVYVGRHCVGVVTSAVRSPVLRKNIALCRIAVEHSESGTTVEVGKLDGQQKRISARTVPIPFYDPERSRVRA